MKKTKINKNQDVRGQFRATVSEAPNSGLLAKTFLLIARLKPALLKFWCHVFSFIPPFLTVGQFLGVTLNQ